MGASSQRASHRRQAEQLDCAMVLRSPCTNLLRWIRSFLMKTSEFEKPVESSNCLPCYAFELSMPKTVRPKNACCTPSVWSWKCPFSGEQKGYNFLGLLSVGQACKQITKHYRN